MAADVRAALLKDPGFGKVFTDHMVTIRWTQGRGWYDAEVRARAPITLDPAAAVLHYGQEIFEGLKAYNLSDGSIALFRPEQNARRFQASAARMTMPYLPEAVFLQEHGFGQVRHGHAGGRSLEAAGVLLRTEQGDGTVAEVIGLQSLEYFLAVVQDGGGRIEGDRRAGAHLGVVPAATLRPADRHHVIREDLAEARILQQGRPYVGRHPPVRGAAGEGDVRMGINRKNPCKARSPPGMISISPLRIKSSAHAMAIRFCPARN